MRSKHQISQEKLYILIYTHCTQVRLAKYAKQSIPEEHLFDIDEYVFKRIGKMVEHGVPTVLAKCATADSERTREYLARSYMGIVEADKGKYQGAAVQLGGTRALLNLYSTNSGNFCYLNV